MTRFDLSSFPLVAILRGLTPADAPAVGRILFDEGFRLLEVPLNRAGAVEAIAILRSMAPAGALVGGGTMLTVDDVERVKEAGGQMMVSPNCDPKVIAHAVQLGMLALPGVATPTEAFRALEAGAHGLKLFPAEMLPPSVVKAMKSVLPADTPLMPVGGINPDNMAAYALAGATGFGIGSQLYKPGADPESVRRAARSFMQARELLIRQP